MGYDVCMRKILVFGVFDGIHGGHRSFLLQAKKFGDYLVIAVARDEVVEKLKNRRPRKNLEVRIKELQETGLADEVIEGDSDLGSWEVVGKVRPDIIALGYDQEALKNALEAHVRKGGLAIEVRIMEPYRPEELHSSIIRGF